MAKAPRPANGAKKGKKTAKKVASGPFATSCVKRPPDSALRPQKRASLKNQLRSNERALKKVRQAVPSRCGALEEWN